MVTEWYCDEEKRDIKRYFVALLGPVMIMLQNFTIAYLLSRRFLSHLSVFRLLRLLVVSELSESCSAYHCAISRVFGNEYDRLACRFFLLSEKAACTFDRILRILKKRLMSLLTTLQPQVGFFQRSSASPPWLVSFGFLQSPTSSFPITIDRIDTLTKRKGVEMMTSVARIN